MVGSYMLLLCLFFSRLMFCIYLFQSVFRSYHILSTKLYYVCTLLLYTSHWKCLFRTEYLFQETLYIHNVGKDLFTLVLIHFDLSYLILLYLLYTNIYGPHWIFCIFVYKPLCLQWTISVGVILLGLS